MAGEEIPFLALSAGDGGASVLTNEADGGRDVAAALTFGRNQAHSSPSGSLGVARGPTARPDNISAAASLCAVLRRLRQRGWRIEGSATLGGAAAGRETIFLR